MSKKASSTRFPVTVSILAVCVILQVMCDRHPSLELGYRSSEQGLLRLVHLVTHMFGHAGWGHLIGNFCFGLPFMAYLESKKGSAKTFKLYMIAGVGALMMQLVMAGGEGAMIGSSGALMGMAGAALVCFGDKKIDRAIAMTVMMVLLTQQLMYTQDLFAMLSGIAFYAHIGGLLVGALACVVMSVGEVN